ncbi:MAG TPA: imidazole glycerol phosphate synthase subunit HisH [Candidatus Acidoferrales bacterium]|jgi:imidazole glycerol phosphate synthase glutamine amidotransferase subunit|nr:imidazole glycerol phosphate synthase subunit HisH [Candidatus Acidoferrales bacterium]
MKLSIIDYGAGNLPSVERALRSLGAETECVTVPEQIAAARALILPGVGHFSAFVSGLRQRNLTSALRQALSSRIPVLGICLGLQALFASSAEAPGESGLDLIHDKVQALPTNVKSPHIGWNQLRRVRKSILLREIPDDAYFYFAHSYAAAAGEPHTSAACDHGFPFAAVVEQDNLMAVQFHPEKSGEAGGRVLRNFLEWAQ